ncbi:hypothetical protein E2C01_077405 [Portunus trituberculatus]|uniref:Uncharacterized protein n=1 Tax=Portunus trituberculatus TaxID=210409 RepID=A0A5B7IK70_PORTR|nr:hypothetical protein [Portunus trituberculatus]
MGAASPPKLLPLPLPIQLSLSLSLHPE